jgi:hypothetical protein
MDALPGAQISGTAEQFVIAHMGEWDFVGTLVTAICGGARLDHL